VKLNAIYHEASDKLEENEEELLGYKRELE